LQVGAAGEIGGIGDVHEKQRASLLGLPAGFDEHAIRSGIQRFQVGDDARAWR
jgi:hypothetical protein